MATKKTTKPAKVYKPKKVDLKAELSKASDSVVSKFFDKKKFWEASKARFDSTRKKPTAVAQAIENTTTLCRDGKIDVINILSALTGKSKDEFSVGRMKPLTLFILDKNPEGTGYPTKSVCLYSKEADGRGSLWSKGSDLITGNYSPPSMKVGNYSHPSYKQFTDWFDKLSTAAKIKFIENVS